MSLRIGSVIHDICVSIVDFMASISRLSFKNIATRVAKFLNDKREIEAIKSTIDTQMSWMTEPMRNDMLTRQGVDFRACRKRPLTIYIILPVAELQSKSPWL